MIGGAPASLVCSAFLFFLSLSFCFVSTAFCFHGVEVKDLSAVSSESLVA